MTKAEKLWVVARFIKNHQAELQAFMDEQGFNPEASHDVEVLANELYEQEPGE